MLVAESIVDLDHWVSAFERARMTGPADLKNHLPPPNHAQFLAARLEIIRVDMELAWTAGRRALAGDYVAMFPDLLNRREDVRQICFEEFRLRQQAGDRPDPKEYESQYGVDAAHWRGAVNMSACAAAYLRGDFSTAVDQRATETSEEAVDSPTRLIRDLHLSDPLAAHKMARALTGFPDAGDKFLDFQLFDELGRGAFSRVYLASEAAVAGRCVALKITSDARAEVRALAALHHSNIVPVYSVQKRDPHEAVCMPYRGRVTFADVCRDLAAEPALPESGRWLVDRLERDRTIHESPLLRSLANCSYESAVLELAARTAHGLAHAHDRGILHRDLKPANILFANDGEPMLLDFNLAEKIGSRDSAAGALVGGTLPYMAPEQLRAFDGCGPATDARADVYAFGLILFELLTGKPPSRVPDGKLDIVVRELAAIREQIAPQVGTLNLRVAPALAAIVGKCLEPSPDRRYASARSLAEDLDCQRFDQPLRHTPEPSWRERTQKWLRRHPKAASASSVSAIAIVLLAACSFFAWQVSRDRTRLNQRENERLFADEMRAAQLALAHPDPDSQLLLQGETAAKQAWDRYPESVRERAVERGILAYLLARSALLRARRAEVGAENRRAHQEGLEWNARAAALLPPGPLASAASRRREWLEHAPNSAVDYPLPAGADDYLVGLELMGRGRPREASESLARATQKDPSSLAAWYARGLAQALAEQHVEAVGSFSTCIALSPDSPDCHHARAVSLRALGRSVEALLDMNAACRIAPSSLGAILDRGLVRFDQNDLKGAESDISNVIDGDFNETRVYFLRARIRDRMGDTAGANADRAIGFQLRPQCEIDWLARAAARLPSDPKAALADLDACLSRFGESSRAWQSRAEILMEYLHRPEEALIALDAAIRCDPNNAVAWAGRAVYQARAGRFDAARNDAQKALAINDSPRIVYQVAGAYALTAKDSPSDEKLALFLLSRAIHQGFGAELVESDPELAQLRLRPEVQFLLREAKNIKK